MSTDSLKQERVLTLLSFYGLSWGQPWTFIVCVST